MATTNASLNVSLPAPRHQYPRAADSESQRTQPTVAKKHKCPDVIAPCTSDSPLHRDVPPYLQRQGFLPCSPEDFGDGGAFPEVHVLQYPLNMGRPGQRSTAMVSVDVDEKGQVRYDAIVKQGANRNKKLQTSLEDMKEREGDEGVTALPREEEEAEATTRTRQALEALLNGKIKQSKPSSVVTIREPEEPTYIRYTPNPNAPG